MAKGANTVRIGAFVLFGLVLVVGAIAAFGSGRLFRESRPVVMNFTASMQGLSRGAPVMFSGVPIGEVTDILLRLDEVSLQSSSAVIANIYPDRFERVNVRQDRPHNELYTGLIEKGLRGRLVPVSIVTGQLGIELGFYPGTAIRLTGGKPGFVEIPTIPSTVERLETTVQKILTLLEGADMEGLSRDVERALQSVSGLLTMPELRGTIVAGSDMITKLQVLADTLNRETPEILASLRATSRGAEALVGDTQRMLPALRSEIANVGPLLAKMDALLGSTDRLLNEARAVVAPDSPLQGELSALIRDLSRTSAAVRGLVTALEDNPNSVLFGAVQGGNE